MVVGSPRPRQHPGSLYIGPFRNQLELGSSQYTPVFDGSDAEDAFGNGDHAAAAANGDGAHPSDNFNSSW